MTGNVVETPLVSLDTPESLASRHLQRMALAGFTG